MMRRAIHVASLSLLSCVLNLVACADAQELPSAREIAAAMKASSLSAGFQLRMRISGTDSDLPRTLKLAIIGQFEPDRARLAFRVVAPETLRNQSIVAQYRSGTQPSAAHYGERGDAGDLAIDPYARLFDAQLVPADMFAVWWDWPQQTLGESMRIDGRDCTVVHSRSGTQSGPLREVDSCVDFKGKLALRTQIFAAGHAMLRTITVEKTMRKEDGSLAARRLTVKAADGAWSTAEVYDGDEHYRASAANFPGLD